MKVKVWENFVVFYQKLTKFMRRSCVIYKTDCAVEAFNNVQKPKQAPSLSHTYSLHTTATHNSPESLSHMVFTLKAHMCSHSADLESAVPLAWK